MTNPSSTQPDPDAAPGNGSPAGRGFFHGYAPRAGFRDELFNANASPREHWRGLHDILEGVGRVEFSRRWRQASKLLHENGIAYSAYGDPNDQARPWGLDPLPVVIPSREWHKVSDALRQRATLLNRILIDAYGPQELFHRGLLPAELLFQNQGFWRPLHRHLPSEERLLQQYAADLARAPDGKWWVLGDRTEAPSGAGYALENRIVTSRMLPDAFHRCHVERLAQYFIALQQTIRGIAGDLSDNPRIGFLSQGPESANYFEDAFLSRYLGYTLVVGADLTIRNNQAMLKTLDGLVPLHVLLRRPNSEHCDPLELDASSTAGVAGLVQAVRSGSLSVVNRLGSGLVEAPLIMAFMPRLCQELLGEELLMPGIATWWCGEPTGLSHVLANLDRLIIRPAFRRRGLELEQSKALAALSREELAERIRSEPHEFVAQEQVSRSTMPMWNNGQLGSSHIALRAFAVASKDSYYVMNGGLARISSNVDPLVASLLTGESSKDVWITADAPVTAPSLLKKKAGPVPLRRTGSELPSRVADNIFWLGRHLERAEAAARLARTVGERITTEVRPSEVIELPPLLRVMAEHGYIEPGYVVEPIAAQLPSIETTLPSSAFDESNSSSLRSILAAMFSSASAVRDRISIDCWRIITRMEEEFQTTGDYRLTLSDLLAMLDALLIDLAAFSGLAMESMTRTHTWRFLDLGRRLERALQTVILLRHCLNNPGDVPQPVLEALLDICDSRMTYRSRYLTGMQLAPSLDLLLTDETNPRSVLFQLASIAERVEDLPRDPGQIVLEKHQRLAMSMVHRVRMLDIEAIAEAHAKNNDDRLCRMLEWLEQILPELSNAIAQRYLTHARTMHRMTD